MHLENINLSISGNVYLGNNTVSVGDALHISDTNISFNIMDTTSKVPEIRGTGLRYVVVFRQNKALEAGGAIQSHANNIVLFTGTVMFIDNSALNSGAIGILQTSIMILVPVLNISFITNQATDSGGALYFKDSQCLMGSNSP